VKPRAWHRESSFLCDLGPAQEALVTDLARELAFEPRDYVLVDAAGAVTRRYRVQVYSIEEELGVTAFLVAGPEFREVAVRIFYGRTYRVSREETVVLGGLREVTDAKTPGFLSGFLAQDQKRLEDAAARARREGEARVAAIPGSTFDPGLGKAYLRAQDQLRKRVRSYGLRLDELMLEVLGRFGSAPRTPSLLQAVQHYAEGCLHAAFDSGVESTRASGVAPDPNPPEWTGLLEGLHRKLLADAQGQEDVDALQNAAAYRRAAECIDRARRCLIG